METTKSMHLVETHLKHQEKTQESSTVLLSSGGAQGPWSGSAPLHPEWTYEPSPLIHVHTTCE